MKPNKRNRLPDGVAAKKTTAMKMVEKYRPRMSRLSDAERQKLMERGLQIIYGKPAEAK